MTPISPGHYILPERFPCNQYCNYFGAYFCGYIFKAGAEKPKVLLALGNISRHLTSMLTTKMRFYSNLANYPRPMGGGSIFSFTPTGGVLILPGCEPTAQGTWVSEGSGTLEDRVQRASSQYLSPVPRHTQDVSWMGLFWLLVRNLTFFSPPFTPLAPRADPARRRLEVPFERDQLSGSEHPQPSEASTSSAKPSRKFPLLSEPSVPAVTLWSYTNGGLFLSRTASRRGEGSECDRACELGSPMGADQPFPTPKCRGPAPRIPATPPLPDPTGSRGSEPSCPRPSGAVFSGEPGVRDAHFSPVLMQETKPYKNEKEPAYAFCAQRSRATRAGGAWKPLLP